MKRILIPIVVLLIVAAPTEGRWQFCRLRHEGAWSADYPLGERKLVAMLKDVIRIDAAPRNRIIAATEQGLSKCAFVVISNANSLFWSPNEARAIGDWVKKGGFLWTDGIWSDDAWKDWNQELKKALPRAQVQELGPYHPIFNHPFQIQLQQYKSPEGGWVKNFAVEDHRGRLMVLMTFNEKGCRNCGAVGDAWQDFEYEWQSKQAAWMFSINVLLHIMAH